MSMGEIVERVVDVEGRPVRVLERGAGPVATVLLHGGLAGHGAWEGSADLWRPVMERLEGRGGTPRVLALDLPGAGGSPVAGHEELTIAGITARVASALRALGVEVAVGVGHGEASLVALLLARSQRDDLAVPGAMVVAALGAAPTSDGVPPLVLTEPPAGQGAAARARWALDRLSWSAAHVTPEIVATLAAHAGGSGRASARQALDAPGARERLDSDLLGAKLELFAFARDTGFDVPLAIVWGAEDPLLTVDHGDALFALLATTRSHLDFNVIPRAGHLVFREEPAVLARLIAPLAARVTTHAAPTAGAAR
jgi:pimeloyl-ACP methyl ester carboxylesterase